MGAVVWGHGKTRHRKATHGAAVNRMAFAFCGYSVAHLGIGKPEKSATQGRQITGLP
jgi:hypothetical protein